MSTKKQNKTLPFLSIMEAVDTLSSIVDLDFESDSWSEDKLNSDIDRSSSQRTISWLSDPKSVSDVRNIFKAVLYYLKNFYKKDRSILGDDHTIEGVKNVMVLVGEAAKKLDRLTHIFNRNNKNESITSLEEYRELEAFYQKRISKKIDENVLGKWILGLAKKEDFDSKKSSQFLEKSTEKIEHVFIDFEVVKKDSEYELFFLRKADGSRFFNSRLIRNMKLISDFEHHFDEKNKINDPLLNLEDWKDKLAQMNAENILKSLGVKADHFYRETAKYRKLELPGALNSALMALTLSSYKSNRISNNPAKTCREYFKDFQYFLSQALQSREYQKYVIYKPNENNRLANTLLEIVHAICRGLFVHLDGYQEILPFLREFFNDDEKYSKFENIEKANISLWQLLSDEYAWASLCMKAHANGPLIILLQSLEEGECTKFAPLKQENFPIQLYSLYYHDQKHVNIRLPAPISQEFIDKVFIDESFYGFLRSFEKDSVFTKYLIINLQDRTSWREGARCQALEHLKKTSKNVEVVTLAFDTEFYHQLPPYDNEYPSENFIEDFYEHLNGTSSGFYFSSELKEVLFPDFIKNLLDIVHKVFFVEAKELDKEQRLNFIDIFYFFLVLKVIEEVNPTYFSMVCKDSIDVGGCFNLTFYTMMKLLNKDPLNKPDLDCIHYLTYIPSLLIRERMLFSERYDRFLSLVKMIEAMKKEWGGNFFPLVAEAIEPLFDSKLFHGQIIPSHL